MQEADVGQLHSVEDDFYMDDPSPRKNFDSLAAFDKYRKIDIESETPKARACRLCRQRGHNKRNCPTKQ